MKLSSHRKSRSLLSLPNKGEWLIVIALLVGAMVNQSYGEIASESLRRTDNQFGMSEQDSTRTAQATAAAWAQTPNSPSAARYRYLTRFETQRRVSYEPKVSVVEKTMRRLTWNPFQPAQFERRLVPTVHWVPTIVQERMPVTERLALHDATDYRQTRQESTLAQRDLAESPIQVAMSDDGWRARKNPRLAAQNDPRPDGAMSIDRVPTRNFQTRSIVELSPTQFGGVQRFDDDVPRVGMHPRDIR